MYSIRSMPPWQCSTDRPLECCWIQFGSELLDDHQRPESFSDWDPVIASSPKLVAAAQFNPLHHFISVLVRLYSVISGSICIPFAHIPFSKISTLECGWSEGSKQRNKHDDSYKCKISWRSMFLRFVHKQNINEEHRWKRILWESRGRSTFISVRYQCILIIAVDDIECAKYNWPLPNVVKSQRQRWRRWISGTRNAQYIWLDHGGIRGIVDFAE